MSICNKTIGARHLVKDYRDLKRKMGRQPTCLEFAKECHSITTLAYVLGRPGWRKLLGLVGGKPFSRRNKITRESVEDCYRRLKAELGRIPTAQEYSRRCCSGTTLSTLFGGRGWSNLLKSVGDHRPTRRYKPRGPSRTSIVSAFRRIQRQLGKAPKYGQFRNLSGYSRKDLERRFGEDAWQKLLESVKVREGASPRQLTAEHLVQDFLDLQQALGRRPRIIEYTYNCHTPKVLDRVFGKPGWKNLISAVGARALPKDVITAAHLVDDYIEIHRHLGRAPAFSEFRSMHRHTHKVLDREFGKPGWSNLKIAAQRKMREHPLEGGTFHGQLMAGHLQP